MPSELLTTASSCLYAKDNSFSCGVKAGVYSWKQGIVARFYGRQSTVLSMRLARLRKRREQAFGWKKKACFEVLYLFVSNIRSFLILTSYLKSETHIHGD